MVGLPSLPAVPGTLLQTDVGGHGQSAFLGCRDGVYGDAASLNVMLVTSLLLALNLHLPASTSFTSKAVIQEVAEMYVSGNESATLEWLGLCCSAYVPCNWKEKRYSVLYK